MIASICINVNMLRLPLADMWDDILVKILQLQTIFTFEIF